MEASISLIYLHGFASGGDTPKTRALKDRFPDELVIAPNLDHNPDVVMKTVDNIISRLLAAGEDEFILVGSSLGGFYANCLGNHYDIPRVLINPAITPSITLRPMLGEVQNFATGETFIWQEDHLSSLWFLEKRIERRNEAYSVVYNNTDVVIARDDDVIDVDATIVHYQDHQAAVHIFDEGGHRFNNMDPVYSLIEKRLSIMRGQVDVMADVDI